MHKRITLSAVPKKLQISASKRDDISFFLQREKRLFFNAHTHNRHYRVGAIVERLNFEEYEDFAPPAFYASFYSRTRGKEIEGVFRKRGSTPTETLNQFLAQG